MSKRFTTIAFAGLLAVTPVFAQTGSTGTGTGTTGTGQGTTHQGHMQGQAAGQLTNQDQKFVMEAAQGGMMEVELGRLAAQKASSAEVKAFGQRMVTDHSKANQQLMQLASNKGLTLSKTLPADMQKEHDKLAGLSGAEFDRMYMKHMLKDHKKDVSEFEKESQKATDTGIRSFAQQTLPVLREHLTLAQSTAAKVGVKTDTTGHSGSH
jgi:putative membrane protein